jgi:hypothetical protein
VPAAVPPCLMPFSFMRQTISYVNAISILPREHENWLVPNSNSVRILALFL